jgi:hypothetical protein
MNLPRALRPILVLVLAAAAFGQIKPQVQSSPAPDFLAYQAVFRKVVSLESQAAQADAVQGPGNASGNWYRSQFTKESGLTNVEYTALVAIAQDYAKTKAAYITARDAVMTAVQAQQAAGGKATWAQIVQLSNLFQQYLAMVNAHIAQVPVNLGAPGAQALANYVHTTVVASTAWAR